MFPVGRPLSWPLLPEFKNWGLTEFISLTNCCRLKISLTLLLLNRSKNIDIDMNLFFYYSGHTFCSGVDSSNDNNNYYNRCNHYIISNTGIDSGFVVQQFNKKIQLSDVEGRL